VRRIVHDLGFATAGCLTTASQIHLARECLTQFSGSELCLGTVLGCWLGGIALGSPAGAWLARRRLISPAVLATALLVLSITSMILLRLFRAIIGVGAGEMPGLAALFLAGLTLVLPIAFLAGAMFPVLCRAAESSGDPQPVGRVYAVESLGAAAGGALVSMWAAGILSPFLSLALCALPALAALPLARSSPASRPRRAAALLPSALLLIAAAVGLPQRIDDWSAGRRFQNLQTGERLVDGADTPYQRLDLAERGGQYSLYGDGKLLATFPDPWRIRPRAHLVLTQHAAPRRVLWLGSSGLWAAAAVLRHGVERLTVVDLDPGIFALIEPHLSEEDRAALRDERVRRVAGDGRRFLRETPERFDVIFSDAPDPTTAARSRFFSREFFRLAREHLSEGGLFALGMEGSYNVADPFTRRRLLSSLATLRSEFPAARALPGAGTFLLGTQDPQQLRLSAEALSLRYRDRAVEDPLFHPAQFAAAFEADAVGRLEAELDRSAPPPINVDGRPAVMLFGILRESLIQSPARIDFLEGALAAPAAWWLLLCLLPGAALAAWAGRRAKSDRRRLDAVVSFAAGVGGATGLGLEIALSLAYQSLAGSLYRELGLLLSGFMLGLALAGVPLRAYLRRRPATPRALAAWMFLFAAFAAAVPPALEAALTVLPFDAGRALILFLVVLAGAGTGVTFPLAAALVKGASTPDAAARINRSDHLGAAAGAFGVGMVLIPLAGWTGTCLLFALLLAETGLASYLMWRHDSAD